MTTTDSPLPACKESAATDYYGRRGLLLLEVLGTGGSIQASQEQLAPALQVDGEQKARGRDLRAHLAAVLVFDGGCPAPTLPGISLGQVHSPCRAGWCGTHRGAQHTGPVQGGLVRNTPGCAAHRRGAHWGGAARVRVTPGCGSHRGAEHTGAELAGAECPRPRRGAERSGW